MNEQASVSATATVAALAALNTIAKRMAVYHALNRRIEQETDSDFAVNIPCVDGEIYTATVALIDAVLGQHIASYFLCEGQSGDGGSISWKGRTWRIKTIDDVRQYVSDYRALTANAQR